MPNPVSPGPSSATTQFDSRRIQHKHCDQSEPDVFVSGGGPAGLAAAISIAQQGLSVEVADGLAPPIDKACGEGLMPDTIAALEKLGVDVSQAESSPFHGIRFLGKDRSGRSVSTQAIFPGATGQGMKRPLLHQLLLDRALQLGVRFSWKTVVQGIEIAEAKDGEGIGRCIVRTNRHTVRPRYIVGADGHQSRIRAWANLDGGSISGQRIGLRQHFAIAPWTDLVEVYWSDNGQAYVTPISANEVCVAFIARRKFPSVHHALCQYPELQRRLESVHRNDSPRGAITISRKLRRVTRGNIALVGDASGSVDAVTGEGLGLCFRQAIALGDALRTSDLSSYQRQHLVLRRMPHLMAQSMLLLDDSPRLRNRTLTAFQRRPRLFEQLLSVHIGQAMPRLFGAHGLLAIGLFILAG